MAGKPHKRKDTCIRGHDLNVTRSRSPNGRTDCSECRKARNKEFSKRNPDYHLKWLSERPSYQRAGHLLRKFNLTIEAYDNLLASQGGACGICGRVLTTKNMHVDHDHETKKVRGVLCFLCNSGLGFFKDNEASLAKAIEYLEASRRSYPGD